MKCTTTRNCNSFLCYHLLLFIIAAVEAFAFTPLTSSSWYTITSSSSSSSSAQMLEVSKCRSNKNNKSMNRGQSTSTTTATTSTRLNISNLDIHGSSNGSNNNNEIPLRFLGKGDRAVVRPGVVLVAPLHEYSHWLMKSAVFIHAIGINEYGEHVTRGVIVDHPSAFTMGEMGSVYGTLGHNILFRGGDVGNDSAILLHSCGEEMYADDDGDDDDDDDGSTTVQIECGDMIGTSGIFEGGVQDAMDLADRGLVDTDKFKFFFNYVEFTDIQLQNMLKDYDEENDDAWASFEVPQRIVLENDLRRGDTWSYLRNQMKQILDRN